MESLKKLYFFLRNRITYYHVISMLLVCILVMGYFSLPLLIELFQKRMDLSLELPVDTIPFLILERVDKNSTFSTVYLAFWDIANGKIYRDDVQAVCEVNGDIDRVFWSGNKQIFLTPSNERGKLEILSQDATFQISVNPINHSYQTLIKQSYDGKRIYQLSVDSTTGKLSFDYQSRTKSISYEVSDIPEYSDYKFVKPINLTSENLKPVILCFVQSKTNPEKGLGIMEGSFQKNNFNWSLHQEMNQSLELDNVHDCNFYNSKAIVSREKELNIEQLINDIEIRPFSAINNYLRMFHNYLFRNEEESKIFSHIDVDLVEKDFSAPNLNVFREYLLVDWVPNFTSSKKYSIKHIIAQNGIRSVGRIEVLGSKIRIYRDTVLVHEEEADNRYLDSQWVFPNE